MFVSNRVNSLNATNKYQNIYQRIHLLQRNCIRAVLIQTFDKVKYLERHKYDMKS